MTMATTQTSRQSPGPSLPACLREFHQRLPLAGDPPNAVLSLPDDRLLYLVAILRDTPQQPPVLDPEEWQAFLDLLRPHGVFPLLAYRLRSWPENCRPPLEVVAYLDRLFLYAAARSMRAGRQRQQHYTPQGHRIIEPRDRGRSAGSTRGFEVLHTRPSVGRIVQ